MGLVPHLLNRANQLFPPWDTLSFHTYRFEPPRSSDLLSPLLHQLSAGLELGFKVLLLQRLALIVFQPKMKEHCPVGKLSAVPLQCSRCTNAEAETVSAQRSLQRQRQGWEREAEAQRGVHSTSVAHLRVTFAEAPKWFRSQIPIFSVTQALLELKSNGKPAGLSHPRPLSRVLKPNSLLLVLDVFTPGVLVPSLVLCLQDHLVFFTEAPAQEGRTTGFLLLPVSCWVALGGLFKF